MHKAVVPGTRSVRNWSIVDTPEETPEDGPIALLRSITAVIVQHKLKLILWVAVCVVLAAFYARTIPPAYTATASLLLEPRRQIVTSGRETAAAPTLDLNRADSEIQVIRSERLLTQVFEGLDLANHPEFVPQPPGAMRARLIEARHLVADVFRSVGITRQPASEPRQPGATDPRGQRDEAATGASLAPTAVDGARRTAFENFANFAQRLTARRVGQSYVVEISYSSSDPALAARVANAAVSAYLLQSVAFKADAARSGAEFLQGRVDALSGQVRAAAAAIRAGVLPDSPTPDADARVIGAAREPLSPSAPRSGLIIGLGGILGVMSGFFVVALGSVLDRRIRTAQRLTRETGIPCLATVPEASTWNGLSRRSEAEMDSLVVSQPEGAFAAAIRDLRTSIKLACSSDQGEEHHVIALVSCTPNTGCSLLCMNLARLIQRSGKKATVIDADVHGAQRDLTGGDPYANSSLVDALANNAGLHQIAFLDLDGVAVLPAASSHTRSNYFVDFRDPKVAYILDFARSKGDVLLDLPPMSGSADARALAMHADAVVIAVTAGRTTVDELKEATRALKNVGANVIGAVINRAKM